MSLTYQPFALVPEVDELRKQLPASPADGDTALWTIGGAVLVLAGLTSGGLLRWLLVLGGGAMIRQAWQHAEK